MLDRALQRWVDFEELYRAHCRNLGRAGSAATARLLCAARDRAASEAERKAMGLLRDAGLIGWVRGYRIGEFEVDLAFVGSRVAIEIDGWAWHSDVERFRHDRRRQNALVLAGWTVLRFTWHDLSRRHDRRFRALTLICERQRPKTAITPQLLGRAWAARESGRGS